jgi:glycosyltransferase involved in cell wall biosynthesis
MKVAMVVNSDPLQDGRVRKEARSLVAAGHDVTVFGVRASDDRSADASLGFPVVFAPIPEWVAAGGALATFRRTARWFERMRPLADAAVASRPDVVHAHDLDTVGPASRAARAAGIPCVYDDHEASYVDKLPNYAPAAMRGPKRAVLAALTRRLQRRGEALEREVRARGLAAIVTVSEPLADRLVARFGGPRPVVVRNCPEFREVPRTDALRERIGAPRDAKLLLYHGTATEGSGIEVVVRALRLLPPHYLFAIVGRVWRQDRYEALARDEGVAGRVRFVPIVPHDEMIRLVASADVGLVPTEPNSEGNAYGLANKFFESMMAGLPLVASATPAVRPILERVRAGLLYPAEAPQDPAALAAAARRLCEDATLWDSCREAGLRAAREEFNWERESRALVAVYERLASGTRRPA